MTESTLQALRDKEVDELLSQGWTMVVTGDPRKKRDIESLDEDVAHYEEVARWCEQQFGGIGELWTAYGFWMFMFKNVNDAFLFKLSWGMTK